MKGKLIIYIIVSFFVIWSMESININQLFKQNRVYKAQILYFFIGLSIIYLVTNFIMDLFTLIKFF